jgi:hypothetical protein
MASPHEGDATVAAILAKVAPACGHLDMGMAGEVAVAAALDPLQLDDVAATHVLLRLAAQQPPAAASEAAAADDARWPAVAAAALLLRRSPAAAAALAPQVLSRFLLPFLAGADEAGAPRRAQAAAALGALVAAGGAWDLASELLRAACDPEPAGSGASSSAAAKEAATLGGGAPPPGADAAPGPLESGAPAGGEYGAAVAALPEATRVELAARLLAGAPPEVLEYATAAAFPAALRRLAAQPAGPAAAALGRHLLPAVLAAAQARGELPACLELLWDTCRCVGCMLCALSACSGA